MEKNLAYVTLTLVGLFFVGIYLFFSLNAFSIITGRATTQNENVTITVGGFNPVTINVNNGTLPSSSVSESSTGSMLFYVTVSDADGATDINTTSVHVNFTRGSEPVRTNSSCVKVGADLSSTSQNYSCTVDMWYFDEYGAWSVTVGARDLGNTTLIQNTTTTFYLPAISGIVLSPQTLTWATVSQGAVNQTSNNDPTLINNTGNVNSTINITGINLYGVSDPSYFINVANFSAGNNTGSSIECDLPASTRLTNGTTSLINNTFLSRGNASVNNGQTGQEQIYYCLLTVPTSISSQSYSTAAAGSWTVRISA